MPSQSLDFFYKVKNVSGSQKSSENILVVANMSPQLSSLSVSLRIKPGSHMPPARPRTMLRHM